MRTNGNIDDPRHLILQKQYLLEEIVTIYTKYQINKQERNTNTSQKMSSKTAEQENKLTELIRKINGEITQLANQTTADTDSANSFTEALLETSQGRPNDTIAELCKIIFSGTKDFISDMGEVVTEIYGSSEHAKTKKNLTSQQLIAILNERIDRALQKNARSTKSLAIQANLVNALIPNVKRKDSFDLKRYQYVIGEGLDKTCAKHTKALGIPYLLTEKERKSTLKDYNALISIQEKITPIFESYTGLLTNENNSDEDIQSKRKALDQTSTEFNKLRAVDASDRVIKYAQDITNTLKSAIKAKLYPKKKGNPSGTLKGKANLKKILSENPNSQLINKSPNSQLINKLSNAKTKLEEYNDAKSYSVFSFFFTFAGSNKPARTHMTTMLQTIKEDLKTLSPSPIQITTTANIESIRTKYNDFTDIAKQITNERTREGRRFDRLRFWNDGNSTAKMNSVSKLLEEVCDTLPKYK